jgi:xylulokinase
MYYIGFDIGSSSVKVAIVEADTGKDIISLYEPADELEIIAVKNNWAEQDPEIWWQHVCVASKRAINESHISPADIKGIGISYQMHGLVVVNEQGQVLRNSIIWCDSRAVQIGTEAYAKLGHDLCADQLLNSPGNFTASKLKWVKENEPEIYEQIYKFMLPGDYIAFKLAGQITTTKQGLSEGILWDYKNEQLAMSLLDFYGIDPSYVPTIVENFTNQGEVHEQAAKHTGLPAGIPITYRAGDQPNNALSLNVFNHGEVAATGGTSGVIYAVTDQSRSNEMSRINHFAHVNYSSKNKSIGKLLCINGAGAQYRWLRKLCQEDTYKDMNAAAANVPVGSDGVVVIPFGNGAERMLDSKNIGAHFLNLNLNIHTNGHVYRAGLEGIAFSFVYGIEILKHDNATITVIRAGNDNLFRSTIFAETVATLIDHEIEIYNTTGALGAARAVGLSDGDFDKFGANSMRNDHVITHVPKMDKAPYKKAYQHWKNELETIVKNKQ